MCKCNRRRNKTKKKKERNEGSISKFNARVIWMNEKKV